MKTIRDVMSPDPISVEPQCPLADAITLLIEHEISGLPVVDEAGRIMGILSELDLLGSYSAPQARSVGELMTRDPVSIALRRTPGRRRRLHHGQ